MVMREWGRRLSAEVLGTAVLVAAVVGSGIMGRALSQNDLVILLVNMLATVAALGILIWLLGPLSGAHFNPAVTLVATVRREIPLPVGAAYVVAQVVGALVGVAGANVMFDLPAWHLSATPRTGAGLWLGEVIATAGLLVIVAAVGRPGRGTAAPLLIAAWIGSAYFFTASTSFANPAVTIGRAFTDTFTGIAPASVPGFVAMQLLGAGLGAVLAVALLGRPAEATAATGDGPPPGTPMRDA